MNNILKLFIVCFIAVGSVTVCMADDVDSTDVSSNAPVVTARMDCKTLKAKIDELSANGKSDELSRFQLQYRKDCVVRANGLRTSYRGGALPIASASADAAAVAAVAPAPVAAEKSEPATATLESAVAENTTDAPQVTETVTVEISAAQHPWLRGLRVRSIASRPITSCCSSTTPGVPCAGRSARRSARRPCSSTSLPRGV